MYTDFLKLTITKYVFVKVKDTISFMKKETTREKGDM